MPLVADNLRNLYASLTIFALVIAGLVLGKDILIPLALATIFTFILSPLVRILQRWRIPQGAAAGIVFAGALAAVVGATFVISTQILQLTASLSDYRANLTEKARALGGLGKGDGVIRRATEAVDAIDDAVRKELKTGDATRPPSPPVPGAQTIPDAQKPIVIAQEKDAGLMGQIEPFVSPLAIGGLTLIFTLFLLLQYQDLRDRIVRVAGVDNLSGTTAAMTDAGTRLSRLFFAQALLNSGYGLVVAAAMWGLGVPNPILWGVLAAIMRFVPFIGSFIAAVPPVLLAAGVEPGWTMALATLVFFVVSEFVVGHFVEPMVLGKHGGMSPFAMVAAATFWTLVWGPIGLILAAPITLVLVVLGRYVPALEFFSVMLGDEAALAGDEEFYGRLLSKDSAAALAQLEEAAEEATLLAAADAIVLPALRLAAADHRRGRLDDDRVAGIETAMRSVHVVIDDLILERGTVTPDRSAPLALIVPARGRVDQSAADFVGRTLAASSDWRIEAARAASGLTALASRGGLDEDDKIDAVIVVSVGGIDKRHFEVMLARAVQTFPQARVITLEPDGWTEPAAGPTKDKAANSSMSVARRSSLADVAGLLAPPPRPDTSIQPAATAGAAKGYVTPATA